MNNQQDLQTQFLQLLTISENMQKRIISLEKSNQVLVQSNKQLIEWIDDSLTELEHYKDNIYFELMDTRNMEHLETFWYPEIVSVKETLDKLIHENASIARFGDGEFAAIQGRIRHKFQTVEDDRLSARLQEVLHANEPGLLIGIADNYGNLDKYTEQAKREIRHYMTRQVRKEHLALLQKDCLYYDAYITRPYVMYADNQTDAPAERFRQLKQIWNNRDCVFVEGCQTGLGVGNDLFDNAASIKRILGPAENAFARYDEILECCLQQSKDNVFLLALGPTATVLAYDLYKAGYQAIDIGHIDLEYEWFLRGEGYRTAIEGKYNNEVQDGEHPEKIEDENYAGQVIARIFQDCRG